MKKIILIALILVSLETGISLCGEILLQEPFDGEIPAWLVPLVDGTCVIQDGTLILGSKDGEGSKLDTCMEFLDSQNWGNYKVSGDFYLEKSNGNSPFLLHLHREGQKQVFILLVEKEAVKIVEVFQGDFIKPSCEKEASVVAHGLFGIIGAAATANDAEAYDAQVKSEDEYWSVLDENSDFNLQKKIWYKFSIEVKDNSIKFYLDDSLIVQSYLISRTGGSFAVGVADDCRVRIDNLTVEKL